MDERSLADSDTERGDESRNGDGGSGGESGGESGDESDDESGSDDEDGLSRMAEDLTSVNFNCPVLRSDLLTFSRKRVI